MKTTIQESSPDWLDGDPSGLRPERCLSVREKDGTPLASCALWWTRTPIDPEDEARRIGCIGQFDCVNARDGCRLLEEACAALGEAGCRRVVGPMDGDTWHAYRLVTDGWDRAARFFLEPWNTSTQIEAFALAGFREWARYSSSELDLSPPLDPGRRRQERLMARLAEREISVRPLRLEEYEEELGRLFALSEEAFRDNFLYTPITRDDFLSLYAPVKSLVSPDFVLLAEKGRDPLGFVFAVADVHAPDSKRLIVKTLAVDPRYRHLGLGTVLVNEVQERARVAGFQLAVHALQYEENSSLKITRRHSGRAIREYALFHRTAAPS